MTSSAVLNSLDLQANGYSLSSEPHESVSANLSDVQIPHRDGAKLVNYTYNSRTIILSGMITASTPTGLDNLVDAFKLAVIGAMGVNLDLGYAGSTRRYVVNVKNVSLPREGHMLTYVPFSIECEAINPPFGLDTASTIAYNQTKSGNLTDTLTIGGTTQPKALITLTVATKGAMTGFTILNSTTNTSFTVTPTTITNGDVFVIDTDAFTVKQNGVIIATYSGVFNTFAVGTNSFTVTIAATSYTLEIDYTRTWL